MQPCSNQKSYALNKNNCPTFYFACSIILYCTLNICIVFTCILNVHVDCVLASAVKLILMISHNIRATIIFLFIRRLRHRPIRSDFEYLKSLKEELCSKRLEVSRMRKSEPWTIGNLQKVLTCLKDGKSRDSHGLINEIFKPGVGGKDFQISFLSMSNKIRDQLFIPNFMGFAYIVSIYKGKGSKMELENDPGIFIVNLFRSMLMKMVYNDKYDIVDGEDSNVGARKCNNIRNHIFVINGVIMKLSITKS